MARSDGLPVSFSRPQTNSRSIARNKDMIRKTAAADTDALLAIVESSGDFDSDGLSHVRCVSEQYLNAADESSWLTAEDWQLVGVA